MTPTSTAARQSSENILNLLQNSLWDQPQVAHSPKDLADIFFKVRQEMETLSNALKQDSSWKFQFLNRKIQTLSQDILDEAPNLPKIFLGLAKKVSLAASAVLYTGLPKHQASRFIQTHALLTTSQIDGDQVWTLLEKNMKSNHFVGVEAIVNSPNFYKLRFQQIMKIWEWGFKQNFFEVSCAILHAFRIPEKNLQSAVDQALSQNQFDAIAEPVIAHHYALLRKDQQQAVERWVQTKLSNSSSESPPASSFSPEALDEQTNPTPQNSYYEGLRGLVEVALGPDATEQQIGDALHNFTTPQNNYETSSIPILHPLIHDMEIAIKKKDWDSAEKYIISYLQNSPQTDTLEKLQNLLFETPLAHFVGIIQALSTN